MPRFTRARPWDTRTSSCRSPLGLDWIPEDRAPVVPGPPLTERGGHEVQHGSRHRVAAAETQPSAKRSTEMRSPGSCLTLKGGQAS